MDGDLSSRIKCDSCGAESFNNGNTKLHCSKCYDQLQAEIERLKKCKKALSALRKSQVWQLMDYDGQGFNDQTQKAWSLCDQALKDKK